MHGLDEAHSALEYARERSELCATEAKLVLTHEALLAGDYDCQLSGVYGFRFLRIFSVFFVLILFVKLSILTLTHICYIRRILRTSDILACIYQVE
jgi:hypothetical protein